MLKAGMGTGASQPIDLSVALDAQPIQRRHYLIVLLCFATMLVDSFDAQILPYVGPSLTATLHIAPAMLAIPIALGFVGMILGGIFGGMVADRAGRREVALVGLLVFGLGTLGKGLVQGYATLLLWQMVTGLGLGCVYVNVLAIAAEYIPPTNRRFAITFITTANAVGGAMSGYATVLLEPSYGWRAVFYVAAAATGIIFFLCLFALPHSVSQLVRAGRRPDYVRTMMGRLAPSLPRDTQWIVTAAAPSKVPIADVFRSGRAPLTLILCTAAFATFMMAYFITSWTPTLMRQAGLSVEASVAAATLIPVGSLVGSLVLGWLADRASPPLVFGLNVAVCALALLALGFVTDIPLARTIILLLIGFGTGILSAFNGLVGSVYPNAIRGSALGLVLGVGRSGSIIGSLVGGMLLSFGWSVVALYGVPAMACLATLVCMILLATLRGPRRFIADSTARTIA